MLATRRLPPVASDAQDVGGRIRARRRELGLSVEELAARYRSAAGTRTTTNTMGRWERRGDINAAQARVLAELLEVSPAWLLLGEG